MKKIILPIIIAITAFAACVPARKYQELEAKQKACEEELEGLKKKAQTLEAQNKEYTAEITVLDKNVDKLKKDTALLGQSLRIKELQYDKINALNDELIAKLEKLQKGSAEENQKLMVQLEITRKELQRKEDELNELSRQLNEKKTTLDVLSKELEKREQRVKELEELIAKKDEAVRLLKDKVTAALLGFKDKGLTIEQKNGKVYVSMEAKLLFPSGSTKVDPEGRKALIELAKVLQDQADLEILVEGHTDTDKFNSASSPKNNWELSVLRSTAVVEIMLDNSKMSPKTITAAGRSEYLPADPSNKGKNRRIEIILIPNLDELYKIISN
ncbi:MAG: OmpA family protein [Flavobacteriales bacterium]